MLFRSNADEARLSHHRALRLQCKKRHSPEGHREKPIKNFVHPLALPPLRTPSLWTTVPEAERSGMGGKCKDTEIKKLRVSASLLSLRGTVVNALASL